MMQLYVSGNSPYARRARLTVREGGLTDRVEEVAIRNFEQLIDIGPGAKIPVLICDNGTCLCESLIITRYLNDLADGRLLPGEPAALLHCLETESVASVLMDSLFARSMENNQREESQRSAELLERETARSGRCYDRLDELVDALDDHVTLASIAVISALGYANWRAAEDRWAEGRSNLKSYFDRLMARPAFAETAPVF